MSVLGLEFYHYSVPKQGPHMSMQWVSDFGFIIFVLLVVIMISEIKKSFSIQPF